MAPPILIVTSRFDPHADHVLDRMRELGQKAIRLNFEEHHLETNISFGFNPRRGRFQTRNGSISFDEVGSVWWRRPMRYAPPTAFLEHERRFIKSEWSHVFHGLWTCLDCKWVSRPENIRYAGWKPAQLNRAQAMGFMIPRTLISNEPEEVLKFCDDCGGSIVYKTFSPAVVGDPQAETASTVRTTCLKREDLEKVVDKVKTVPCLFQELIPKKYELRVTVIGQHVFTARIDSQSAESTRLDWRAGGGKTLGAMISADELPAAEAQRCLRLVKSFGLSFSAIDLIVTPDDRIVFLESNPNGQWLFVEKLIPDFRMTDSLIDELTSPPIAPPVTAAIAAGN